MQTHPPLHTFRNETNSLVKIHHAGRENVSVFFTERDFLHVFKVL